MLAVSRAVLLGPRFILFDEPVEGLAPAIVENVASLIEQLCSRNTGVLVSDQHESRITEPASVKHRIERGTIQKSDYITRETL
jgi:branched-chain amino acid transport system ATP-binding protein